MSTDVNERLGVTKLCKGTEEAQANAIVQLRIEWNITGQAVGMYFDTVAFNLGASNGACAIFERNLGRSLLYLACQHHVHELPLKAVYEQPMDSSSMPDILLFKIF